jgi:hypothetical protein
LLAVLAFNGGDEGAAREYYDRIADIQRRSGEPVLDQLRAYTEFVEVERRIQPDAGDG